MVFCTFAFAAVFSFIQRLFSGFFLWELGVIPVLYSWGMLLSSCYGLFGLRMNVHLSKKKIYFQHLKAPSFRNILIGVGSVGEDG